MPITIDGITFQKFADAVQHVMKKRNLDKKAASAIVASIESKQVGASDPYIVYEREGEVYAQFFLFNNKMNNAGDPINFQVHPELNEKIARSFINRPYLLPPMVGGKWSNKHHRTPDVTSLVAAQKKHALGNIIDVHQNPDSGNYNAIVKVFPQHHTTILEGRIPPFTSPMFATIDSYLDADGKLHIKDAIGVHLQGVISPGYDPEYSSIKSVCTRGLDECMNDLKIVAASGKLQELQQLERFSIANPSKSQSIMSQQQQEPPSAAPAAQPAQPSPDLEERFTALEKMVAELAKTVAELAKAKEGQPMPPPGAPPAAAPGSMPGAAGTGTAMEPPAPTATPGIPSPTGDDQLTQVVAQLDTIKKERETERVELQKEKDALVLQKRLVVATEIVESKIKLMRLPLDQKETAIKELVELKTEDGQFVDLTLLHSEVTAQVKALVGATGDLQVFELAELGTGEPSTKNHILAMEEIGL